MLFKAIQISKKVLIKTIQFSKIMLFCLHTVKCQNSPI